MKSKTDKERCESNDIAFLSEIIVNSIYGKKSNVWSPIKKNCDNHKEASNSLRSMLDSRIMRAQEFSFL